MCLVSLFFFSFDAPAPTEIYTLSLHDALPICVAEVAVLGAHDRGEHLARPRTAFAGDAPNRRVGALDRKSTRLNSSHQIISYAVFCLKKKKKKKKSEHISRSRGSYHTACGATV